MIYLFHGDNQVASRKKLTDLVAQAKREKKEVIGLNGLKVNLTQVLSALESSSLFGQEKLVVIENLFSRLKSKEKGEIINYLKNQPIKVDLIFWEGKIIPGTTTRWLPKNWQIQEFKTPVVIFKFLESLRPGNTNQMLNNLHQSIEKNNPEMVFYMLVRQIRLLILAKDSGRRGLFGAPWQINKLLNQANYFTLEQLINLYQKLLAIDIDIKTGRSFMPLDWHLDLLIASL